MNNYELKEMRFMLFGLFTRPAFDNKNRPLGNTFITCKFERNSNDLWRLVACCNKSQAKDLTAFFDNRKKRDMDLAIMIPVVSDLEYSHLDKKLLVRLFNDIQNQGWHLDTPTHRF